VAVERLSAATDPAAAAARVRELVPTGASVASAVAAVLEAVRAGGDAAVCDFQERFDRCAPSELRVSEVVLGDALSALDQPVRDALEVARSNVDTVARAWLAGDRVIDLPQGQRVTLREVPVRRAAIYAPGGQAPYPSSIVMGVATARAAGVPEVAVCATHPVMQAAAALCGADEVYAMGGAQAIAAFAYGTESVAPVDVIVGPGSLYAQEAKRQVFGHVGIDGFAGPSDLVVIATPGADPEQVALDALAQAEHGAGSAVAVVSTDTALLRDVAGRAGDPDPAILALVEAPDADAALAFSEAFAPEHLQLAGADAVALAPRVTAAGCVFVGSAAGTAYGDYVAGSNHILPTEGAARFASGLNVRHFVRTLATVEIGPDAAAALAPAGAAIARAEGFTAHAASMEARMDRHA
jgi:histidinol dehydrogenase